MISTEATAPLILAQAGGESLQQFIPLLLILGVFYFLLIRPQQQSAKEHQAFVEGIKKADRVVTLSGLYGTITEVKEKTVLLEIAQGVKVKVDRDKIAGRDGGNRKEG